MSICIYCHKPCEKVKLRSKYGYNACSDCQKKKNRERVYANYKKQKTQS